MVVSPLHIFICIYIFAPNKTAKAALHQSLEAAPQQTQPGPPQPPALGDRAKASQTARRRRLLRRAAPRLRQTRPQAGQHKPGPAASRRAAASAVRQVFARHVLAGQCGRALRQPQVFGLESARQFESGGAGCVAGDGAGGGQAPVPAEP